MRTPHHSVFHHSISNIIVCCFCAVFGTASTLRPLTLQDVIVTYTNHKHPSPMQQVVVYNKTGEVYVGARNTLYHFNSSLKPLTSMSTGPNLDNPVCLYPTYPCIANRTVTDNDCKVLQIVPSAYPTLLNCGTLYQGLCTVHRLNNTNLHARIQPFNDTVGFVSGNGTTVAFFAERHEEKLTSLFTAASYDDRPLEYSPASVSSRIIAVKGKEARFKYAYETEDEYTGLNFAMKKEYKVDYIHGFSSGDFAYFLTTQRVSVESEVYETRLARVCVNDRNFFSYTEVPLKCNYGIEVYNLATAANIGVASIPLKRRLKLDKDSNVLYVSFVRTVPDHGKLVDRSRGSVICSFPLSTILTSFTNATRDCFKAELRTSLLKHVTGLDLSCIERNDVEITDSFCGSIFNHYIAGRESIQGGFRTHLNAYISSMAFTLQNGRSIAVVGTGMGEVIKLNLDKREQVLFSKNIAEDQEDKKIQSSNAFDPRKENIYLLTGNKVVKFPIGSCTVYTDCASCLSTDDPLNCGWCGDHCAHFNECEIPDVFTKNFCAPVIYNMKPVNGPTEGGTLLTITGDNFGASQGGENHSKLFIKVAGIACEIFSWRKEELKCKTKAIKDRYLSGPVEITVSDLSWEAGEFNMNGTAFSEENFTYLTPILYGIYPGKGPISGGTNITLEGYNLNIGYSQEIKVAGMPCKNLRVDNASASCMTEPLSKQTSSLEREVFPKTGAVVLNIDNALVEVKNMIPAGIKFEYPISKNFRYLLDPEIDSINPQVTTVSGTKNLTITGRHLDSVEVPRMIINVASSVTGKSVQIISEPCWFDDDSSNAFESSISSSSGNTMICPTPHLKSSAFHAPTERAPLVTHVAFLMDGVQKLRQLPMYERKLSQLLYYPDPEYEPFDKSPLEVPLDQPLLEIKGKYLNLAHDASDVKVLFDSYTECIVETLSADSISCAIPKSDEFLKNVTTKHNVTVHIGSMAFPLGLVQFLDSNSVFTLTLVKIFAPILLVGAGILACCKIIDCVKVRRKRKYPDYRVTFSWNEANSNENSCTNVTRQPSNVNDYQDLPGRRKNRQNSVAGAASAESCEAAQAVDDETMHLLQSENILVPRNYLSLGEVIGEGHFGCVYKGELQIPNKEDRLEVAVKTLHNSWSTIDQDTEAFLQEGLMMKDFHHINVLTLIGICFEANGSPMVIIPFMKYGDLKSYIGNEDSVFSVKDLIIFGVQIAAGMKYLSEIKFVHRDLAARNCMLNEDKVVKVADFGLSRDIYERDYYSSDNKKTRLPIKWMAPESIEKGSYTTKSDVWSYGVVLWELMTRGVSPYPSVDNWDILQYIKLGRRMPQPSYCPDSLYEIMMACWNEDPRKRPSFAELEEQVQNVITKLQRKNKQRTVGLDVTYVNYPTSMAAASND